MTQNNQPNAMQNLPPEMAARLQQIQAGLIRQVPAEAAPQASLSPIPKPPSLMDHIIALRAEVAELKNQLDANSNVVDAVGQAVGTLYQMFQPSTQVNAPSPTQGSTYSQTFQQSVDDSSDY